MKFIKMQGAGNDFILVETNDTRRDWSRVASAICDRHYGVGADGLLLSVPSRVADFGMRIFNPDGSESGACGNGLRCLVKHFVDKNSNDSGVKEISVETIAGIRRARVFKTTGRVTGIQTDMGEPRIGYEEGSKVIEKSEGGTVDIKSLLNYTIAVKGRELCVSLVSVGNPHAVHFQQGEVSDFPLSQLGPKVERHRAFPARINFEVARVISRQQIEARVWERGVGETLACGSGACAVAVIAQLHGFIDSKVDIKLPGGILAVEWDGVGEVLLSGPAEVVFTGEWLSEV